MFAGTARIFDGEQKLLEMLDSTPEKFQDGDMIVVRYEGPVGGPGMPEMLDSTSRITALCRERGIVVGLMTDGRFSGGSVGLVIGHVGQEAAVGGPIGLLEDGDQVIVDLNSNELNCPQLDDPQVLAARKAQWDAAVEANGGTHPSVGDANTRLLNRMRCSAVSAVQGAGMHPGGSLFVPEPRAAVATDFTPANRHRGS